MDYLYLIASVLFNSSAGILGGYYNRKNEGRRDTTAIYNLIQLASVFIGWVLIFLTDISFEIRVLPYALLFAAAFTGVMIGQLNALKTGPIALTSLMVQLSLIGTTVWGFFFWDSPVTVFVILGLILVALSLVLCLCSGKKEEHKISLRWLFWVGLAFVSNAVCSITQRTQQMAFDGKHGSMLMVFATFFSLICCLVLYLRSDRSDSKVIFKSSWYFPSAAGFCNALLNLFIILLATSSISPSLVYPANSVGVLMITTLFSLFAFREKLSKRQWIGILLGAVATALLSIG